MLSKNRTCSSYGRLFSRLAAPIQQISSLDASAGSRNKLQSNIWHQAEISNLQLVLGFIRSYSLSVLKCTSCYSIFPAEMPPPTPPQGLCKVIKVSVVCFKKTTTATDATSMGEGDLPVSQHVFSRRHLPRRPDLKPFSAEGILLSIIKED